MSKTTWIPEMYDRLSEIYPNHSNADLVKLTGYTLNEIIYRAGLAKLRKSKQTNRTAHGKFEFTLAHETFIRDNFDKMSNKELASAMGFKLQFLRAKCHAMKLYRMKLEYWTDEQVAFLRENYRHIGDKELASIFNTKWKKNKTWTLKHIEKKRSYLKLKRTKDELNAIRDRNVELSVWSRGKGNTHWLTYGVARQGEIRMIVLASGRLTPMIKVGSFWKAWARYTWEQAYGTVPKGMMVCFKNDDPMEYKKGIAELELLTRDELADRNRKKCITGLSDNYVAGMLSYGKPELKQFIKDNPMLIELKRNELLLTRAIKQHERPTK